MSKILSIFFLSIYLLGATELHQLVKIPQLVEHYRLFEKQNPGFGMVAFLRVHYVYNSNDKDYDYAQDMKLPFKDADFNCVMAVDLLVPKPYYFVAPKTFLPDRDYPAAIDTFHDFTIVKSIFQPPKA